MSFRCVSVQRGTRESAGQLAACAHAAAEVRVLNRSVFLEPGLPGHRAVGDADPRGPYVVMRFRVGDERIAQDAERTAGRGDSRLLLQITRGARPPAGHST